ncbi:MAG: 1-deoxy-D-xylulose-5-phosphate reductoisomerase, partial [Fusobacterium sp.]|nr:1-deoxy-D-xylulose-5-phosphate reductoisomerase [Fusobacterium sp.]
VAAGVYINKLLNLYQKAEIIPVDSEHSAIFQSLQGFRKQDIKRLIITASGGTFRGKSLEDLKDVSVEQALKHPNWTMGKKITIDSSTLVNKGLEIIEAHELFGLDYDKIDVIVHPESVIHSMIEYVDGSIISQMGVPDMKTPILYAFSYPEKEHNSSIKMTDFSKYSKLTFEEPEREIFKGIDLAYRAGEIGQTMPAVLNAANEIAVELFLSNKIKFLDIYRIIEEAMEEHKILDLNGENALEIIKKVDSEIRVKVREKWGK